jgi:2-(1,2-epoxy-1,2-dihydrophenyl)acetyl-CoA isomerase
MNMNRTVLYETKNKTAVIKMNRPHVKNAINREMHEELHQAFSRADEDPDVRVIVLTGEGDAFSSGADLKSIPVEEMENFDHGAYLAETYNKLILLMDEIEKPIVAYVNGLAVGAGLSLALACDFRYADKKAAFSLSFLQIGLAPDAGASYYLPRIVGLSRAIELGTGVKIDTEKAERIGLISGTDYPEAVIQQLTEAPAPAYGLMKKNFKNSFDQPLESVLEEEIKAQRLAGKSRPHQKALQAFLQKSKG